MHFYENRGSASASPAPAEPIPLDLPDAAPWTGNWSHLIAAWLFGAVILAGLVTFIMHFGTIEIFVARLRGANPLWLAAAVSCQLATYVSAAAVWFRVLKRAGSPLPFLSLLRLAFVELFANQAVPTGGLSGSLMVVRGLMRRGVVSAVAVTALLISALSYYAAYLMVGLLAFVLLWHSGDLNAAWRALFIAFAIVVATLGGGTFVSFAVPRQSHPHCNPALGAICSLGEDARPGSRRYVARSTTHPRSHSSPVRHLPSPRRFGARAGQLA